MTNIQPFRLLIPPSPRVPVSSPSMFCDHSLSFRVLSSCLATVLCWFSVGNDAQAAGGFTVEQQADRLLISLDGSPITDFVFNDKKILRPYFANLRLTSGLQVTRNHPPIEGVDDIDHDTMHPGVWLGFGDISGSDFWRNKAPMEHVRFVTGPDVTDGQLSFATECRLFNDAGQSMCLLTNRFTLTSRPVGWLLTWDATFHADSQSIRFGDQEEMGFGARVATQITEKNGGRILNSNGLKTAQQTWGQPATWCDYSGISGDLKGGITLMTSPTNFRESWWHNRDYGVFVANPFGRQAMKQGKKSSVEVSKGESLHLRFGALIHQGQDVDFAGEYATFSGRDPQGTR
jgi:hypothetical protein